MVICLGILSILAGVYFTGCEVTGTYEFLMHDQGAFNYIVAAGVGVAAALPVAPALASLSWALKKRVLSAFIWALFCVAVLSVVMAAVARTGTASDQAQAARVSAETARNAALATEREATDQLAIDQATEKAECKTGNGNKCKDARRALSATQGRLDSARAQLIEAPPPQSDAQARRIVALALLFNVKLNEDSVRMFQPMLVPVLTSGFAAAFMALGTLAIRSRRRPPPAPPAHKPQAPARDITPAPVKLEAPRRNIVKLNPIKELAAFAQEHIRREPGGEVSMRDVVKAYEHYCATEMLKPLGPLEFIGKFAELSRAAGVSIRVEGRHAYLEGVRLVTPNLEAAE